MRTKLYYIPDLLLLFILGQLLPYKFMQTDESQYIFTTIWDWIWSYFWENIWDTFWEIWWYIIGSTEFIAIILLLIGLKVARYKFYGSVLATIVLSGAIFFHIFSPLWIVVQWDSGYLFILALLWLISSIYMNKKEASSCHIS